MSRSWSKTSPKEILGTAAGNSELDLNGTKKAWFHLGKVEKGTTEEQVKHFLSTTFPDIKFETEKLKTKGQNSLHLAFSSKERVMGRFPVASKFNFKAFFSPDNTQAVVTVVPTVKQCTVRPTTSRSIELEKVYDQNLCILAVNVQCLRTKFDVLSLFVAETDPYVLCLSEHWLRSEESELYSEINILTMASAYYHKDFAKPQSF